MFTITIYKNTSLFWSIDYGTFFNAYCAAKDILKNISVDKIIISDNRITL